MGKSGVNPINDGLLRTEIALKYECFQRNLANTAALHVQIDTDVCVAKAVA